MNFIDKLPELINKLPDPIKKICTRIYNKYVPLYDPTERQYYEIAYGLLASNPKKEFGFYGIKKYVEHHLGAECDETKLKNALRNFKDGYYDLFEYCDESGLKAKAGLFDFSTPKVEKLIEINRQLDQSPSYRCSEEKALEICYKETLEKFKSDFDKALVEATSPNKRSIMDTGRPYYRFYDDTKKLVDTYMKLIGKKLTEKYIHNFAVASFFENNKNMEKIVFETFYKVLHKEQCMHLIASLVLRALRFDAFTGKAEEYTSISEKECKKLVLNYDPYLDAIAKKQEDEEDYIQHYTSEILNSELFEDIITDIWMPDQENEVYYTDAVCHRYWKSVAKEYKNDTKNPEDICDMIWDSIALTEEELQEREEEARERRREYEEYLAEKEEEKQKAEADKANADEARRQHQEREAQTRDEKPRWQQELDQQRDEDRELSKEFYVLYIDQYGKQVGYVNSYKNAHIKSLGEVEKYWSDHFNPRCYNLKFVKATESRLEYEQWKR